MKGFLRHLIMRYRPLLTYSLASITAASLDFTFLFILNSLVDSSIVWINTASVMITATIHYLWISKISFRSKIGAPSAAIYIATFVFGIILQNFVIWFCFDLLSLPLFISKGASLSASFFILFFLRKALYEKYANKEKG